jgi:manganese transport protein
VALLPAVVVIALSGNEGTYKLLILSQVVLSMQLPFAIVPLIHFTSAKNKMGNFSNPLWVKLAAWISATIIIILNLKLVFDSIVDWAGSSMWLLVIIVPITLTVLGVLLYIVIVPFFRKSRPWDESIISSGKDVASRIQPKKYKNIGVAIEHSAGDSAVISEAITQTKLHQAKLTLIHIVDTPGTMVYGAAEDSLHSRSDYQYIEELAREIEERDLAVETVIRHGNPAEQIIKSVAEEGIDLLVLGSHGHQIFGDIIHGQTVDNVRHSVKIPILVVRTSPGNQELPLSPGPGGTGIGY